MFTINRSLGEKEMRNCKNEARNWFQVNVWFVEHLNTKKFTDFDENIHPVSQFLLVQ